MQNFTYKDSRPKICVTLAGFHTIMLESVKVMLESGGDFSVVNGFNSVRQLLEAKKSEFGDVILLNLVQGDHETVELIREIHARVGNVRIVVLTGAKDLPNQKRAVELGAAGIVQIEQNSRQLFEAIKQVNRGETWINHKLLFQVLNKQLHDRSNDSPQNSDSINIASLSQREREVIAMIGKGLKNKEIASQLIISEATVRHHLRSIYGKLDLPDRLNLIIYAYQHGLVTFNSSNGHK